MSAPLHVQANLIFACCSVSSSTHTTVSIESLLRAVDGVMLPSSSDGAITNLLTALTFRFACGFTYVYDTKSGSAVWLKKDKKTFGIDKMLGQDVCKAHTLCMGDVRCVRLCVLLIKRSNGHIGIHYTLRDVRGLDCLCHKKKKQQLLLLKNTWTALIHIFINPKHCTNKTARLKYLWLK